jgi:hypothetical protein
MVKNKIFPEFFYNILKIFFHQKKIFEKKCFLEIFNFVENNMIHVEPAKVLW